MAAPDDLALLSELVEVFTTTGRRPEKHPFDLQHLEHLDALDRLIASGHIRIDHGRYAVAAPGLALLPEEKRNLVLDPAERVHDVLKSVYIENGKPTWNLANLGVLAQRAKLDMKQVDVATFYDYFAFDLIYSASIDDTSGSITNLTLDMRVVRNRAPKVRVAELTPGGQKQRVDVPAPSSATAARRDDAARGDTEFRYDAALSFAGEQRDYVAAVARALGRLGVSVFYDADEEAALWGKDLMEHLDHTYRKAARYCVMFISREYAEKAWPTHERRSALARALNERQEYILPVRFDDTDIDGLRPTVAFVDARRKSPEELSQLIAKKLSKTRRPPGADTAEPRVAGDVSPTADGNEGTWNKALAAASSVRTELLRTILSEAAQSGAQGDVAHAAILTAAVFDSLRIHWTRAYRKAEGSDAPDLEGILPALGSTSAHALFPKEPSLWQEPSLAEDKYGPAAVQALGFELGDLGALRRVVRAVEQRGTVGEDDLASATTALARRIVDLEKREPRIIKEFAQACEAGLPTDEIPDADQP